MKDESTPEKKLIEAKSLLAQETKRRTEATAAKIQAVLAEDGLKLDVQIQFGVAPDGTIKAVGQVILLPVQGV